MNLLQCRTGNTRSHLIIQLNIQAVTARNSSAQLQNILATGTSLTGLLATAHRIKIQSIHRSHQGRSTQATRRQHRLTRGNTKSHRWLQQQTSLRVLRASTHHQASTHRQCRIALINNAQASRQIPESNRTRRLTLQRHSLHTVSSLQLQTDARLVIAHRNLHQRRTRRATVLSTAVLTALPAALSARALGHRGTVCTAPAARTSCRLRSAHAASHQSSRSARNLQRGTARSVHQIILSHFLLP